MSLSIVLPAYQEEENLRLLLPRLKQEATLLTPDHEILVVDTQTPMDCTPQVCQDFDVTYVNRSNGNDYGDAVRSAIAQASKRYLVFMDADGSHSPSFLRELYSHRDSFDVVVASRYIEGGHTENSVLLIWMSRIVNFGYSLILGISCQDVSNSFKLYRTEQIKSLNLKCCNFDIVEEILYKLIRLHKVRIKEVPFCFKQRLFGRTKRNLPVFVLSYLYTLLKLRFFV